MVSGNFQNHEKELLKKKKGEEIEEEGSKVNLFDGRKSLRKPRG